MSGSDPIPFDPPDSIQCPCGGGEATHRTRTITEPFTFDGTKTATHHHYRHDGCSVGGTVVCVDGLVHRQMGPLFHPNRYGLGNVPSADLATDGGVSE